MPKLVPVIEGDGEVEAVPVLLRRLLHQQQRYDWQVAKPKNAHGVGNLSTPDGLERFVDYALNEPDCAGVLVLLDNDAVRGLREQDRPDDDCAPAFAGLLARRARTSSPAVPVSVVVARWEYEAWFLASLETIAGKPIKGLPGLPETARFEGEVEAVRSPKGWIEARFPPGRKYSETRDQAPLTQLIDFGLAEERSRSFRRLKHAVNEILESHARGEDGVTPHESPEEPHG